MFDAREITDTLEADIYLIAQYSHLELDEIEETELSEAVAAAQMRTLRAISELVDDTKPIAAGFGMPCESLTDVDAVLARARGTNAEPTT